MNIGFVGPMGSGKTAAAHYLEACHGFTRLSLATPIKTYIKDILDIDKTNPEFRSAAQELGSLFRKYNENCWVDYFLKNMPNVSVVVDDIRFKNEVKTLLLYGFKIIYLDCPEDVRIKRCLERDNVFDRDSLNHVSETNVPLILKQPEFLQHTFNGNCRILNSNRCFSDFIDLINETVISFSKPIIVL
jgi:dephospho-CoA kinase